MNFRNNIKAVFMKFNYVIRIVVCNVLNYRVERKYLIIIL